MPRSLWWITALWVSLLLGASVVWPVSYGLDEPYHFGAIVTYSSKPLTFYGPGQMQRTASQLRIETMLPLIPGSPKLDEWRYAPRGARPTLAQLGGATPSHSAIPNQMEQHPPLYYEIGAFVLHLPGVARLAWDQQMWLIRLLSIVLMAPVPLLCWASARRLMRALGRADGVPGTDQPGREAWIDRAAIAAALVPLTIPNLVREGGAVTNDDLLIPVSSALLYLLTRVMTGDRSRRTAAGVAVTLAAALYTKGFALAFPPFVVAAYAIGARRARRHHSWLASFPWSSVAVALAGAVLGGTWWLRNLIDYGAVQVNGYGAALQSRLYGPQDNTGTLYRFVPRFVNDVIFRTWGEIGIPDQPSLGNLVIYGWFLLVAIGVAAAVGVHDRRARYRSWVLAALLVTTALLVFQGSWADFRHWSNVTHGTQGRYLYHLVAAAAALAAIGWFRLLSAPLRTRILVLLAAGAVATNAAAWLLILHSWYTVRHGMSGLAHGLRTLLYVSPLPEWMTIPLVVALPAACGLGTLLSVWRDQRTLYRLDASLAAGGAPAAGSADDDTPSEPVRTA